MSFRLERVADAAPGAKIWNDAELAEVSGEEIDLGAVGVSITRDNGDALVWDSCEEAIAWAEDLVRRLRAGEGRSAD